MHGKAAWLALYVSLTLSLASCNAWNIYSSPYDCADDQRHGPDPGTVECDSAIKQARANRSQDIREAFVAPLIFGGVFGAGLLALWHVGKAMQRRGYFVDDAQDDGGTK